MIYNSAIDLLSCYLPFYDLEQIDMYMGIKEREGAKFKCSIKWLNFAGNRDRGYGRKAYITYDFLGRIKRESWWVNNKRHNTKRPADIHYYDDGSVWEESWWINGQRQPGVDNKPAYTFYFRNGNKSEEKYFVNGKLHSINDIPAVRIYHHHPKDGGPIWTEEWYNEGLRHRDIGPAYIVYPKFGGQRNRWFHDGTEIIHTKPFTKICLDKNI